MAPLATRLRPSNLDDFLGQHHLVASGSIVQKMLQTDHLFSMIFWGPPATGKTTLARIVATQTNADWIELSAVMDGKSELKKAIERAKKNILNERKTILFVDEIHRWNKAQQDALLPYVENGILILIGATTENPSFTIINALLSRTRVLVFEPLDIKDIVLALEKGSAEMRAPQPTELLSLIAERANGDVRFALNSLEIAINTAPDGIITEPIIASAMQLFLKYDKNGELHYDIISAVHKSLRSSDADAATYWICRMLDGGEDPLYIARRLLRFASEDIGNSSPTALMMANTVYETCQKLGMPECGTALIQLAQYLARAPKNNNVYTAYSAAMHDVKKYGNLSVPLHLRNAPTKLMKDIGYGKDYQYDHDLKDKKSSQQLMPDTLKNQTYFERE